MLKQFLIFLSILCFLGAGYFTYDKWIRGSSLDLWDFVPENAAIVYENANLGTTLDFVDSLQSWTTLMSVPELRSFERAIDQMDSILKDGNSSRAFFDQISILVSVHVTARKEFDYLFMAEISNLRQHTVLTRLQEAFSPDTYKKSTRKYMGFSISEISDGKQAFSFIFYKNFFVGSYNSLLVEDVIRTVSEGEHASFADQQPELFTLAKLSQDQGNVYVNLQNLMALVGTFQLNEETPKLAKSAFLDLAVSDKFIELSGFSFTNPQTGLFSVTSGLNGASFDLAEVISIQTGLLYHFSFSDREKWKNQLNEYNQRTDPQFSIIRKRLLTELDFDVDYVFDLLDQEVGLSMWGSESQESNILYLEVVNSEEAIEFFGRAAERHADAHGDTLFVDTYKGHEIRKFPDPGLARAFLGSLAGDFEECYFSSYRNYLFFTNSLPQVKSVLDDIENENTWKKSLRKSRFLDRVNQEASLGIYVHTPAIWNDLSRALDPKWQDIARKNDYIFRSFENMAVQTSSVDDKYFTSILIDQPDGTALQNARTNPLGSIRLAAPLVTKPYLVKNHNDGQMEVMVQDSANNLYLISPEFDVLWSKELAGRIKSGIFQIDYYKNNKLQYLFITEHQVHILDRNGEYLPEFPKSIARSNEFEFLGLIDYESNKNYRFAIVDIKGNVYLTDKDAKPLDGWAPLSVGSPLSMAPVHYRIGGTDAILLATTGGEIHSYSRKARDFPGFPYSLNEPVSGAFHVKTGSNFQSTVLTAITSGGRVVSINLKGGLQNKVQLVKNTVDTQFRILNDIGGKNFLLSRQSDQVVDIMDRTGNVFFSKNYLSTADSFLQYYHLTAANQYIVVGDKTRHSIYIYDLSGRLVTGRPVSGDNPVSMRYFGSRDEYQVYITDQSDLSLVSIQY
ncbi:MAG: hypothetical protein OEY56_02295 [Cyclobacteriaceae bacterium]|nr:hypothetical protein [Cyclobacteriaceae bacterium]